MAATALLLLTLLVMAAAHPADFNDRPILFEEGEQNGWRNAHKSGQSGYKC